MSRSRQPAGPKAAKNYRHPESESLLRSDVGTQAQFQKKKKPATYRYDSSVSPALDWDGQNPAREEGEYEDSIWDHLAGTVSAPFEAGEHQQIAVKVIDDRGNELLVVRRLEKAAG